VATNGARSCHHTSASLVCSARSKLAPLQLVRAAKADELPSSRGSDLYVIRSETAPLAYAARALRGRQLFLAMGYPCAAEQTDRGTHHYVLASSRWIRSRLASHLVDTESQRHGLSPPHGVARQVGDSRLWRHARCTAQSIMWSIMRRIIWGLPLRYLASLCRRYGGGGYLGVCGWSTESLRPAYGFPKITLGGITVIGDGLRHPQS